MAGFRNPEPEFRDQGPAIPLPTPVFWTPDTRRLEQHASLLMLKPSPSKKTKTPLLRNESQEGSERLKGLTELVDTGTEMIDLITK